MKTVALTQGKVALVDDEDFERVSQYLWNARRHHRATPGKQEKWYAAAWVDKRRVLMHRFILQAKAGELIDHRDGDGLNNTRKNIRPCNSSQNVWNRASMPGHSSRFKGVSRPKHGSRFKPWRADIRFNGIGKTIGYYVTEEEAARAYDAMARKYHGEFARLNFPQEVANHYA